MLSQEILKNKNVLLKDVHVLDVNEGRVDGPVDVLISGDTFIDTDVSIPPASGCDEIECDGLTLIPGLFDCHAHILSPFLAENQGPLEVRPWMLRQMKRNLEESLAAGVVCVRDMMSPVKQMNSIRRKLTTGKWIGPDILVAGPILSCEGGYPPFLDPLPFPIPALVGQIKAELQTPEQVTKVIHYLMKFGVDLLKIGYTSRVNVLDENIPAPVISDEVFEAICTEAKEHGFKTAVHHSWGQDLKEILKHEIDSLEHVIFDRIITQDEALLIKDRGVSVVPTLTITDSMARFEEKLGYIQSERAKEMFEPQAIEYLTYLGTTWLNNNGESYGKSFGMWRANRKHYGYSEETTRILYRAGVNIIAGTDLGAVCAFPGEVVDELIRFVHSIGMTPNEAIRSGTIEAAKLCGRDQTHGTIEPGKKTDVAMVEGNPLEDIRALRRVRMVGKNGNWFRTDHAELPDFWQGHSMLFQG